MFWHKSRNVQISDVSDVKTAKILFEFLIDKKIIGTVFLTINRLINYYFYSPENLIYVYILYSIGTCYESCRKDF